MKLADARPSGTATITQASICAALTGFASNTVLLSLGCSVPNLPVGGTVSGLQGSVVLTYNGGSPLTVSANGAFTFGAQATGTSYTVAVQTQPVGQICNVSNGSGTVTSTSANAVSVNCFAAQPITYSGLAGSPSGLVSDGTSLWVTISGTATFTNGTLVTTNGSILKMNPDTGAVLATVPAACEGVGQPAFDGTNIWVPCPGGAVDVYAATSGAQVATYNIGQNTFSILFDGTYIWLDGGDNFLYAVVPSTGAVQFQIPLGLSQQHGSYGQGVLAFDGVYVFDGNQLNATVNIVKASTGGLLSTIATPANGIDEAAGNGYAFYSTTQSIYQYETPAGAGSLNISTSTGNGEMAFDGSYLFINLGTSGVSVVDPNSFRPVTSYSFPISVSSGTSCTTANPASGQSAAAKSPGSHPSTDHQPKAVAVRTPRTAAACSPR